MNRFGTFILGIVLGALVIIGTYAYYPPPEHLICYEPYGAPVEAEYVLQGTILKVIWTAPEDMPEDTEAYARWVVDWDANASWCVIHAQFPEQVLGDPRMDALGHELLHCLVGDFHP